MLWGERYSCILVSHKQKQLAILVFCLSLFGQQLEQHRLRHTVHSVNYGTLDQLVAGESIVFIISNALANR